MTESEWLACDDPQAMLEHLRPRRGRCRTSERKLRLFACACCRRTWHLIPAEACRNAVEVADRHADERITEEERLAAWSAAYAAAEQESSEPEALPEFPSAPESAALTTVGLLAGVDVAELAAEAVATMILDIPDATKIDFRRLVFVDDENGRARKEAVRSAEQAAQVALLRDIVGNPFRPARINRAWLARNDGTLRRLAEAIYEERAFNRLPLLADALLDAGCDNEELISHCRSEGPHVRGCWAVDLLLGRE
jgi:hypothetical protein